MDGLQLTILFRISYLLLSRAGPEIVTCCAKKIDGTHGIKDPLEVTRGNTYGHLGMTNDFLLKTLLLIIQCYFSKKMNLELPEGLR